MQTVTNCVSKAADTTNNCHQNFFYHPTTKYYVEHIRTTSKTLKKQLAQWQRHLFIDSLHVVKKLRKL